MGRAENRSGGQSGRRNGRRVRAPGKVLLAEDEVLIAELYQSRLELDGWSVRVARDGVEALAMIQSDPPAIAVLDIQMPRLGGLDVLRVLRSHEETRALPVLILSNTNGGAPAAEARELGALDWLVKVRTPPDELSRNIAQHLGRRQDRSA